MGVALHSAEQIPVTVKAVEHLRANPTDAAALRRAAVDFRFFLNYWWFVPEGQSARCLGDGLWEAQDIFAKQAMLHNWIFFLKARQLGESTIECAFDAWRLRFGGPNSRVHITSRTDVEAKGLLDDVVYGLNRLPDWMKLPTNRETTTEYIYDAGENDERTIHAYPSSSPGRGETCTHAHVDEWADMINPTRAWSAVEPSVAPGGTCHIVTTGMGPQNYTSQYWRKCLSGDTGDHAVFPCFVDALKRPDRTPEWYAAARRAQPDEAEFLREYPMKWEDALSGGGEFVFTGPEVDAASRDARGCIDRAQPGRKYVKGWDIGRHQDAAVCVVLDVTEDVHDVIYYLRLRENTYPQIQLNIEAVDRLFPGPNGVEKNAAGEAVIENLNWPEQKAEDAKFTTSQASKARIIMQVKLGLQNQQLKWNAEQLPQLDNEVRGYQLPDDNVVQDSMMALAIAEEFAAKAHLTTGTVGKVTRW